MSSGHNSDSRPGGFLKNGGFRIARRKLPRRWDYLLAGPGGAARFCQNGLVSLQAQPPGGRFLLESAADAAVPPLVVWIHDGEGEPFTHVFSPTAKAALQEPDEFSADFLPGEVVYSLGYRGWNVRTVFRLDPDSGRLLGRVAVSNTRPTKRNARIVLAAITLNAPPGRHAWDPVGLYQRAGIVRSRNVSGVVVENRSPDGDASKRASMGVFAVPSDPEVLADRAKFSGNGSWTLPEFVVSGAKEAPLRQMHGVDTVAAFAWTRGFDPRETFNLSFAAGVLSSPAKQSALREGENFLSEASWKLAARRMDSRRKSWEGSIVMKTPDGMLDDYVNSWLSRQLSWVSLLDRGWATGLRGVRDAAQDFTAVAWIDPSSTRDILRLLFSAQRSDGWFPRQVAIKSGAVNHDLRAYVDSGCWVVESLYDYLRVTGDRRFLSECLPWLDAPGATPVLDHLCRAVDYYLAPENRGPHNLILIRGGDWNDAIHLAGIGGRGESVMTSCQAVLALRQAAEIVQGKDDDLAAIYRSGADELRAAIRAAALNKRGFLRGVSTDDGRWIFSERDPDGCERINVAVQAWGIIAGVLNARESRDLLRLMLKQRGPHGVRLFHPPLGAPPIAGVGRVASGDLMAGVAENGTVYNHGSQAFLARAAAVAGDGDALVEILHWALPCYAECHPTDVARTPPYAMVNCWMETPGHDGEGGALFLTGAVGVLRRVVIEGLLGFQPGVDGVRIQPCLPKSWPGCSYTLRVRGRRYDIRLGSSGRKQPAFIPWTSREKTVSVKIGGKS